jgi:hypothetical protein
VGSFPEGLLQKLADQGVNAVWLHTVLRTLVKDPKYPEFGDGCERRIANLGKLVERAAKYGVKVYLYMNEPRALDPSFFRKPGREGLGGAVSGGLQTMCSSSPETIRWLEDSLEKVFVEAKGLGGIFTISASENLSNCATRPGTKATCPRCKTKSRAEIIAEVNRLVADAFESGSAEFARAMSQMDLAAKNIAVRDLGVIRAAELHFRSVVNQLDFIFARNRRCDVVAMRDAARRELAVAKEFLPIVRCDSRIGFEASNHYYYLPIDIVEKVLVCRQIIEDLVSRDAPGCG